MRSGIGGTGRSLPHPIVGHAIQRPNGSVESRPSGRLSKRWILLDECSGLHRVVPESRPRENLLKTRAGAQGLPPIRSMARP
jgi:hypothetical protein